MSSSNSRDTDETKNNGSTPPESYPLEPTQPQWQPTLPDKQTRSGSSSTNGGTQTSPRTIPLNFEMFQQSIEYDLTQVIGSGGMGTVYAANQQCLDRDVAIKCLNKDINHRPDLRESFLREAFLTASLDHPNIVPVYELGVNNSGDLFYVMKRIQGHPWSQTVGSLSIEQNLAILLTVTDAISFAHSKGIIHRDIKPDNVMIGPHGAIYVVDWGLACDVNESINDPFAGSPSFMAPEMAHGEENRISYYSDIYLLGANLYFLLTGCPPHAGKSSKQCLESARDNTIPHTPFDLDNPLMAIAFKAMHSTITLRFGSVTEFAEAIREWQRHQASLVICQEGYELLQHAASADDYARALFSFETALKDWPENIQASKLLSKPIKNTSSTRSILIITTWRHHYWNAVHSTFPACKLN